MLSKIVLISALVSAAAVGTSAQTAPSAPGLLARHYVEGEKLSYHMNGSNRGRTGTLVYEADAAGVVKKNAAGKFVEEYAWSNLVVNGAPVALSPAAAAFRQQLSLDEFSGVPDLSQVIPLIGPITDTLTFYVDLLLATRQVRWPSPATISTSRAASPTRGRTATTSSPVKIPSILISRSPRLIPQAMSLPWSFATWFRLSRRSRYPPTGCVRR
jgi:hypothetical protein